MPSPRTQDYLVQLLESVPLGLTVWELDDPEDDGSLRLLYANTAAGDMSGIDLKRCLGQRADLTFPRASPKQLHACASVCRDGTERDVGVFQLTKDTTLQVTAKPLGGNKVALLSQSVTALKRAEQETRELNRFLDSIIDQVPAMIFIKDAGDLRFERFNRAGEELLNKPQTEMIGKNDFDFFPPDQASFFIAHDRKVLESGKLEEIPEEPIQTPRGTRWLHTRKIPLLDDTGKPRHLLGISMDITERKQAAELLRASHGELERRVRERTRELEHQVDETKRAQQALALTEEQLRQSQKMEAIGRLAGGVAHDFNNLLSVVLGYSELILGQLPPDQPLHAKVEEIRKAGARAAELTRQLLAFSRRQMLQPRVVDLNEIVSGMARMLPRLLGEDIELRMRLSPSLEKVRADPSQLEQVIMNLVINARDALPTGGQLTIATGAAELGELDVSGQTGAHPGRHVFLAVSDNGIGMDKHVLQRVFEPFFTTKEQGKGTGLGLSTVLGIVQQSGGLVRVRSEPRKGSVFHVFLPVTEDVELAPHDGRQATPSARGHETVLLVEDDDQVRSLAGEILRHLGYQLLEARRASQALALASAHAGNIDLLVTDVVMPEMGGSMLAQRLREARPSLRVLFMSGYTDDAVVRHGILEAGVPFLQKPLTPEALARGVREVLESRPTA